MSDWVTHAPKTIGTDRDGALCGTRAGSRQLRTKKREVSILGFGRAMNERKVTCERCLLLL